MKRIVVAWILVMMVSCAEEMRVAEMLGDNSGIFGTWVENGYIEEMAVLERAGALDGDSYGFTIREDGTFIERKNAGFYDTPPVTYTNFDGEWVALSDSLLEITVGYWGGTINYQMRIVSLERDTLKIRYLYGENRADSK